MKHTALGEHNFRVAAVILCLLILSVNLCNGAETGGTGPAVLDRAQDGAELKAWAERNKQIPDEKVGPATATKERPWINSLGMPFVPVHGTKVLFCQWEARVKDFEAFVNVTGYNATSNMYSLRSDGWKQRGDTWKSPGFEQGPTHAVCGVSWEDAQAFCKWLTGKERQAGLLTANQGYRLPTDAEWSVAVGLNETSGGTPQEKNGKVADVFPWGIQWPPSVGSGNYAGEETKDVNWPTNYVVIKEYKDGYDRTSPVGSFNGNSLGLFDLGGNVWEWCEDFYDGKSGYRVLRGASWSDGRRGRLLSSHRGNPRPVFRFDLFGFRVVLGMSSP